ncbi:MAG: TatD family hydrolase [Verrucomicrobia bacterium]|nr:TatD family hydrolase [Verrucomicrobiota bacterium]MBU4292334.1 TatD family hydrolase [Verrucomicrobiota bacterium]MBU4429643.1 TatD family hydrolase [Verrucomicrobiota bacterium]MBU4497976.1 TatD family hydrolase [Verrucomicrobiota bacterium]MCG2681489.1 TatD family hydrolase [Kiritimatiellia bacterium]
MLFDTHVHFDPSLTEGETQAILDRALAAGVERMIAVGGSPEANRRVVAIARTHPDHVGAAVGINRDRAAIVWPADELATLVAAPEIVAVGEVGLDFHSPSPLRQAQGYGGAPLGFAMPQSDREAQIRLFERMLEIARDARLPVIVHSRAAEAETIALLEEHARNWPGPKDRIGVQHCFTGTRAYAEHLLALGFFISFSGILTFKNAVELRAIAALIPAERLLIETDSPWLAPEPFRGKPNEPAHVRRVAETLAEIRHCPVEAIAAATFCNAERLFGFFGMVQERHPHG